MLAQSIQRKKARFSFQTTLRCSFIIFIFLDYFNVKFSRIFHAKLHWYYLKISLSIFIL